MWSNPLETANLVTFTEEILNGKLHLFVQCGIGWQPLTIAVKWSILFVCRRLGYVCGSFAVISQITFFQRNSWKKIVNQKVVLRINFPQCLTLLNCSPIWHVLQNKSNTIFYRNFISENIRSISLQDIWNYCKFIISTWWQCLVSIKLKDYILM